MLCIDEMFLVYKLQTSKNCKKVKHTMIMILGIIYIFLLYVIFHQQLKITFRKSSATPPSLKKIHSPIFTHSFPKNLKSASPPPFCQHWNFSTPSPPCRKGEDSVIARLITVSIIVFFHFQYIHFQTVQINFRWHSI